MVRGQQVASLARSAQATGGEVPSAAKAVVPAAVAGRNRPVAATKLLIIQPRRPKRSGVAGGLDAEVAPAGVEPPAVLAVPTDAPRGAPTDVARPNAVADATPRPVPARRAATPAVALLPGDGAAVRGLRSTVVATAIAAGPVLHGRVGVIAPTKLEALAPDVEADAKQERLQAALLPVTAVIEAVPTVGQIPGPPRTKRDVPQVLK